MISLSCGWLKIEVTCLGAAPHAGETHWQAHCRYRRRLYAESQASMSEDDRQAQRARWRELWRRQNKD